MTTRLSRKIRSAYGLHRVSSRQVAELLGVSEVSAKSWANGATRPNGQHLLDLAALFAVDPQVFADRVTEGDAIEQLALAYPQAPIRGGSHEVPSRKL